MRFVCFVLALMAAVSASAAGPILVSDFEDGLGGWWAMDRPRAEGLAREATLVRLAVVGGGHGGGKCLEIAFVGGSGFANPAINFGDGGDLWAGAGIDEIRFWLRGDGSDREVTAGIQCWARKPGVTTMFALPVSLRRTDWHEVVLPLAALQAANPLERLSLRALISFQVNGMGELAPSKLWIDDVSAASSGHGGRFASSFLDEAVARLAPATRVPRLGNWSYPGDDPAITKACGELGIAFSSNDAPTLVQQRMFLGGIATSCSTGRPSGAELVRGLGLAAGDMDRDENGKPPGEGVESCVFHPEVPGRFARWVEARVRARASAPWVASFVLSSPISMYGEAHYPASTDGRFVVFGDVAVRAFREWLRGQYGGDLGRLSAAWGERFERWDAVRPPVGPKAGYSEIDTRRCWSDFVHWYGGWLDRVSAESVRAARRSTRKTVAMMLGGPKIGLNEGICLGAIGPMARLLGANRPAFLSDTDSQTLFSTRYTRAACSQYGIDLMVEHVGPPHLQPFHQYNTVLNALACGSDFVHLATLGELFDPRHWFSRLWRDLAPIVRERQTAYVRSDAVMFHSYVTAGYRGDRSNGDCVRLYDANNTLWFWDQGFPSWGRALGSPDVADDAMVEDGALRGRKLLVIPNSCVTVTTRKAVGAMRRWVEQGGVLVAFGTGCLEWTVEADRRLTHTPGVAGMLGTDALLEVAGARPGAMTKVERAVGRGRVVLYATPAWTGHVAADGKPFVRAMMPLLEAEAARAGVRRICSIGPGWDANLMDAGIDSRSGRRLFVADLVERQRNGEEGSVYLSERTLELRFAPELRGEAEIIGFTDCFESCSGGTSSWNPATRFVSIRATLPGTVSLKLGRRAAAQ